MKKHTTILTLALLLAASGMQAQTEVLTGVTRGKDYGVTYILPKTAIELQLTVTRHSYEPGELCRYAERFMRLTDVETNKREYWTLDKVETTVVGLPDRDKTYFVKLKDKSTAPLMELTEEGIVRSINLPYSGGPAQNDANRRKASAQPDPTPDPSVYMTEEMLMSNSSAKMAELVAKEIYLIRESKNALTRGEADFMPQDGAQLALMLDNLNAQEKALMSLFTGQEKRETKTVTVRVEPREVENEVAFRFSMKRGVVDKDDLSGEPAYLSIADLHTVNLPPVAEETKKLDGVAYNVPGKARVTLEYEHEQLYDGEVSVTQFGCTEYLAPVLFNKSATTQVLFDTVTGGLLKVDRGE